MEKDEKDHSPVEEKPVKDLRNKHLVQVQQNGAIPCLTLHAKANLSDALQITHRHINQKIHNVDVARDTAEGLVDNLQKYVRREWRKTQERTIQQLQDEAANRSLDAVFSSAFSMQSNINELPGYKMTGQIDRDVWQMVKHVHYDVAVASSLTVVSSIWFTPVIATLAALLGTSSAENKQISQVRTELAGVVRDIMSQIYTNSRATAGFTRTRACT